jgi:HPt (histidine-containing phosphotransfer) domain-containing protein
MDPSREEIDGALDPERFGELARDLGPEPAHGLVREFLEVTPAGVSELASAAEAGDAEGVARAAHRLRGGCLALGAMHLAAACAAAERAARTLLAGEAGGEEPNLHGLDAHADAVDRAWQATRLALLRTLP